MRHGRHLKHSEVALRNTVPLHEHLQHRFQGLGQQLEDAPAETLKCIVHQQTHGSALQCQLGSPAQTRTAAEMLNSSTRTSGMMGT